jgi:hypothetical protein
MIFPISASWLAGITGKLPPCLAHLGFSNENDRKNNQDWFKQHERTYQLLFQNKPPQNAKLKAIGIYYCSWIYRPAGWFFWSAGFSLYGLLWCSWLGSFRHLQAAGYQLVKLGFSASSRLALAGSLVYVQESDFKHARLLETQIQIQAIITSATFCWPKQITRAKPRFKECGTSPPLDGKCCKLYCKKCDHFYY